MGSWRREKNSDSFSSIFLFLKPAIGPNFSSALVLSYVGRFAFALGMISLKETKKGLIATTISSPYLPHGLGGCTDPE